MSTRRNSAILRGERQMRRYLHLTSALGVTALEWWPWSWLCKLWRRVLHSRHQKRPT